MTEGRERARRKSVAEQRYLRKAHGDPTVHIFTDGLAARGDMVECDALGRLIEEEHFFEVNMSALDVADLGVEEFGTLSTDRRAERVVLLGLAEIVRAGERVRADTAALSLALMQRGLAGGFDGVQLEAAIERVRASGKLATTTVRTVRAAPPAPPRPAAPAPRFLKRLGGDGVIFPLTPALAQRPDMAECDSAGNPVAPRTLITATAKARLSSTPQVEDVVLAAVEALARDGVAVSNDRHSAAYLPKLVARYRVAEHYASGDIESAMLRLIAAGKLRVAIVERARA